MLSNPLWCIFVCYINRFLSTQGNASLNLLVANLNVEVVFFFLRTVIQGYACAKIAVGYNKYFLQQV